MHQRLDRSRTRIIPDKNIGRNLADGNSRRENKGARATAARARGAVVSRGAGWAVMAGVSRRGNGDGGDGGSEVSRAAR